MPTLRKVSGEKAIRILCNKLAFQITGRSGSHVRLSKTTENGKIGTVVPMHKELKIGTVNYHILNHRFEGVASNDNRKVTVH